MKIPIPEKILSEVETTIEKIRNATASLEYFSEQRRLANEHLWKIICREIPNAREGTWKYDNIKKVIFK